MIRSDWSIPIHIWALGLSLGLLTQAQAQAQVDALTQARHDLKLAFTVEGQIAKVPVEHGQHVQAGQLLMSLVDEEGEALVNLWKLRADSDLEVRTREERLKLAQLEESMLKELRTGHAANPQELRRAELNAAVAALELATARQAQAEARLQYDQAKARHERYQLTAPLDGVVEVVAVQVGESVEANKPVLRMVVIDPLLVEAWVPLNESMTLAPDQPAWVKHRLPGQSQPVMGRIISVGQVAESGSQTRLVRIELANPQGLPAGGHVDVFFTDPSAAAISSGSTTQSDPPAGAGEP